MYIKTLIVIGLLCFLPGLNATTCEQQEEKTYKFTKTKTLKENFNKFASDDGWQLVWDFPGDFPLLANSTFSGKFACENGVAEKVIASVGSSNDFGAISISFDSLNKVVHVTSNPKKLKESM